GSIEGNKVMPLLNEIKIKIESDFHRPLPDIYFQLLEFSDGILFESGVVIYSSNEVFERNQTFEVQKYAGDYLAIGDDSGGMSILIPFRGEGVFVVDQGSMDPNDMSKISDSLMNWFKAGCQI
ncbi:SMI1/KNR4 family protein, partial [Acinetobacter oleivorans]|uniref:SMI1/KNR4 family protein n=1 Tax=Acinetobacter oleivorans TaxID=1148157 RepID=UPI0020C65334